jgi:hypothetical protein
MAVLGAEARVSSTRNDVVIEVALVGLRPLTADYAISVRLTDADGRWLSRHDYQPALGAIPTLKWIQGSRVTDRHLLPIPGDFAGNAVRAQLVAYERFREMPVPATDSRFDEVPLGSWPLNQASEP